MNWPKILAWTARRSLRSLRTWASSSNPRPPRWRRLWCAGSRNLSRNRRGHPKRSHRRRRIDHGRQQADPRRHRQRPIRTPIRTTAPVIHRVPPPTTRHHPCPLRFPVQRIPMDGQRHPMDPQEIHRTDGRANVIVPRVPMVVRSIRVRRGLAMEAERISRPRIRRVPMEERTRSRLSIRMPRQGLAPAIILSVESRGCIPRLRVIFQGRIPWPDPRWTTDMDARVVMAHQGAVSVVVQGKGRQVRVPVSGGSIVLAKVVRAPVRGIPQVDVSEAVASKAIVVARPQQEVLHVAVDVAVPQALSVGREGNPLSRERTVFRKGMSSRRSRPRLSAESGFPQAMGRPYA